MKNNHQPVLLAEVIENLMIQSAGIYIDATWGRGGHAREILKRLGPQGRLIGLDRDPEAVQYAQQQPEFRDARFSIYHAPFAMLKTIAVQQQVLGKVQGILMDLGVSSPQLETAARGFSFVKTGPLDMRMDSTQTLTATVWINQASEDEIIQVLRDYGEERYARRIAAAIVTKRREQPIVTTTALAEIVAAANPNWERRKHPATRVFQAIRIFINQELQQLQAALEHCLEILAIGGRLLVISFHSLEDRIVKQFIQQHAASHTLKKIAKIKPDRIEVLQNSRSRSALLRVAEKIV